MTPDERARLQRLEMLVAGIMNSSGIEPLIGDVNGPSNANALTKILALAGGGNRIVGVDNAGLIQVAIIPPPGPLAMGGDVTGTTAASVISQIAALAGGGVRFVGVDNLGNVGALALDRPLAGDVTGTLGASVLSQIAALAGGGTVLVAVNNAGAIISGGAAPGTPDPFAFLQTITDNLVASSAVRNYDFDLTTAEFTNKEIRFKARGYATTKDTGGVPGANLTGSAYVVTDAVYQNANGSVALTTAAAGGAANPMPAINNEMTLEPQACLGLQSGGGSPPNLAWTLVGATTARLQLTATNNTNRGSWEIDVYRRVKAAP